MERRPHLELLLRARGRARLSGGGGLSKQTKENSKDPPAHAARIRDEASNAIWDWTERQEQRAKQQLPPLPKGVPLLVKIDEKAALDFVRTAFGFEVLCEHEDGYLLVATEDVDLRNFEEVLNKFIARERGGGSAAKLHGVLTEDRRLARILAPELLQAWPSLSQELEYIVDLSIQCLGTVELIELKSQKSDETEEQWAERQARHRDKAIEIYRQWDQLKEERLASLTELVLHYGGEVLGALDGSRPDCELPDSVSVRVRVHGDGLRDIVQNFPSLFEACFPEDVAQPANLTGASLDAINVQPTSPPGDAPTICVIDSGIQEGHRLLQPAIATRSSKSFLPDNTATADEVLPDGHGTRVASAVLYPNGIPRQDSYELPCWLQNARVLDASNKLPQQVHPPSLLCKVIQEYAAQGTRLFLHAINSCTAARRTYMSAWAAALDLLSAQHDLLVIQAAGNIPIRSDQANHPGVQNHLENGRAYPDYLGEPSSRIANPGQSLHAVTVGSVAIATLQNGDWRTIAGEGQPSAFSRSGPGMWGATKPDVVEYGGDFCVSCTDTPIVAMPPVLSQAYPETVRSTRSPGPAYCRDSCGTSFAAPKAAHIAARIAAELPAESALTYRALLVNSARWPQWASDVPTDALCSVLQRIGFGVPDVERATHSSPSRVTLFVSGQPRIAPREAHVYQVRVPKTLRSVAQSYQVLVEITLAYTGLPRRTRRTHRSYLSTWIDWKTSKPGERAEAFLKRVLRDSDKITGDSGAVFDWKLSDRSNTGEIQDTRRNLGTVQKDWAVVSGDNLPADFCIAVVGHPGWDHRVDADAPYALCVTFEVMAGDIDLHADVEIALEELRVELGELRVQVPGGDARA